MIILLVLFYILFPLLIIFLTNRSSFFRKVGAIVLAYAVGLILGSTGLIPHASNEFRSYLESRMYMPQPEAEQLFADRFISETDLFANQIAMSQDTIQTVAVLFAIPLLLFSLNFKKWLKLSREAMLSLVLALVALVTVIIFGNYIFRNLIDESSKVSGMLVGIYTGGTPNLAVIGNALDVNPNTLLLTYTYDMVIGAVFLLFLMTIAQRLFNRFLPSFSAKHENYAQQQDLEHNEEMISFGNMATSHGIVEMLKGLGFAAVIVAIAGGLGMLVPANVQMTVVTLTLTTLGILFSNWKIVNRIEHTFQLGMYLILVFSLVLASAGDLRLMFRIEYLHLFSYVLLVVFGSMTVHVFLSYLFRVNTDTTIITIAALTYSPPFVPAVAGALKNKYVIISGLTAGVLGYPLGNYLGLLIAYFLQ